MPGMVEIINKAIEIQGDMLAIIQLQSERITRLRILVALNSFGIAILFAIRAFEAFKKALAKREFAKGEVAGNATLD